MKLQLFIIVTFLFGKAQAQLEAHYKYSDGGFCHKNIYLKIDGTFYYEEGCEGDSKICKGRYRLKGRTLFFNTDTSSPGRLTYIVYQKVIESSDSNFIEIVDINIKPLSNFRVGLLPVQQKDKPFMSEMIEADKKGILKIPGNKFTHFVIQNDIELQGDISWTEFEKGKNFYTIQFNYPYYCLMYNRIEPYLGKLEPLVFKNEKLYNKKLNIRYKK
jgi:hypothetical protein